MTVKFVDGIGSQVDPGDEVASSLLVHMEQPAADLTTYQFWVGACVAQWNEDASSQQCFAAAP